MEDTRYYIISYDLKGASPEKYEKIKKKLNSWGAIHIQGSLWTVSSLKKNSIDIVDYLISKKFITRKDSLLIICVDEEDCTYKKSGSIDLEFTFSPDMFED